MDISTLMAQIYITCRQAGDDHAVALANAQAVTAAIKDK